MKSYFKVKIVKLTKIEKLIKLLSLNPNSLVSYEDIVSEVWKGKVFSIYSLRNVINHIREKQMKHSLEIFQIEVIF